MGRSKFPAKPSKSLNRRRISILQVKAKCSNGRKTYDDADELGGSTSVLTNLITSCDSEKPNSGHMEEESVMCCKDCNITFPFKEEAKAIPGNQLQVVSKQTSLHEGINKNGSKKLFVNLVRMVNSALKNSEKVLATQSKTTMLDRDCESLTIFEKFELPCVVEKNLSLKQKKTVTFKVHPESSDDNHRVSKKYNPFQKTPLVSIMKKESCNETASKLNNQTIVKPSRLTEILKKKSRFESVRSKLAKSKYSNSLESYFKYDDLRTLIGAGLEKEYEDMVDNVFRQNKGLDEVDKYNKKALRDLMHPKEHQQDTISENNFTSNFSEDQDQHSSLVKSNDRKHQNQIMSDLLLGGENSKLTSQGKMKLNFTPSSNNFVLKQPRLGANTSPLNETNSNSGEKLSLSLNMRGIRKKFQACEVCSTITFKSISHLRKYGAIACDLCQKFISKINKKTMDAHFNMGSKIFRLHCKANNNCTITSKKKINLKTFKKIYKNRCSYCWLKRCIDVFRFPTGHKLRLKNVLSSPTRNFNIDDEIYKNGCIQYEKNKAKNEQRFSDTYVTTFAPNTFLSTSKQINWTNALKNILEGRHHFLVNSSNNKLSSISYKPISNALAENNLKFGATPYINPGTVEKFKCIQNGFWNYPQANICGSISKPGNIQSNLQLKRKQKDDCSKISKTMPAKSQKIFYAGFSNGSSFAEFSKRQKIDLKGPRVKHVCRSASIALGQQIATFSNEQPHINSLSILPYEEVADTINCSLQMKQEKWPSCSKNGNAADGCFRKSLIPLESTQLSSEVLLRLKIGANQNFQQCIKEKQKSFNKSGILQKGNVFRSNNPIKNIIKDFGHRFESLSKNQLNELPETIPKKIPTCLISIDFLENYDPAEVSQSGFGLIITQSLPVRALCFLCGSGGCNALLFCACCCEPYHQHCVEDEYSLEHFIINKKILTHTKTKDRFNWICPRCTVCSNCNMSSGSKVKCQKCQKNYHSTCLGTSKRLLGADRPLICANCLNCKVCYTTNVSKFVGNLPMCLQCFKIKKKGNRCSVCQISCEANDFDLKIIECSSCQQWMHYKCERLSEEQYNLLSSMPECIHFICQKCSEKSELSKMRSREWRVAISEEFKAKLSKIVKSLSKTRQASVLLQCSHRRKKKLRYCSCSIEDNYSEFKDIDNTTFQNTQCKLCKIKDVKIVDISKGIFCNKIDLERKTCSLNLKDVKRKVCGGEYVTLSEFNYDMCNIIESQNCDELIIAYKEILSEQFPWFQNDTKACTNALEEDMFDPCVYLSCEETMNIEQETQVRFPDHITEPLLLFKMEEDIRTCISCGKQGDGESNRESRLLYYGHDCWVHVNCALWASDVFEEVDGSLQNVQRAVIRGRNVLCSICGNRGATIKCKVENCEEFYHYPCALSNKCYFTTEKSVYCRNHALENKNIELLQTTNFEVQRPVYVEVENRKKKLFDSSKVQFHIGSLVVKQLGVIHPKYSDSYEVIIPINFVCSRLYWSCKEPWKVVEYTLKTSLQNNTSSCKYDTEINFTVDHSDSIGVVQLGLSKISLWHKSLISKENLDAEYKYNNCDSSIKVKPKIGAERFKYSATYEESIEEEQQTNTDLLPPEIKDVIFDDLPHEILDGISMVDIFPKLMIYDDMIAIESKSDGEEDLSNPVCIELERNNTKKFCHSEDVVPVPLYKNRKDINKNRELFSKNLKASYLRNNFHWSRKIEKNLALKKWKVTKNLQNNRGCDNARSNFYHEQKDNVPKNSLNIKNKVLKTKWCESVGKSKGKKLMQLDGIDDFVSKQSPNTANCTINTECDHCPSIYRNSELYNPHTLTCGSFVTNKNECKVATRCSATPCSVYLKRNDMSQIFLESEIPCIQNIPFTLNTGILETHITNLNQTQYPDLFSYETPLIEKKTDTSIQIANTEFFIHKPFLTSHAGQYYPNCSNVNESLCPNITSNLNIDVGSCPPISMQAAQPVAFNIPNSPTYQIPQIITLASDQEIQLPETYNKLQNDVNKSIGCYHWTSPNDTREHTLKSCKPRYAKQKINADIAISNTELFTRHESQSLYQTEFTAVADLSNKQILSETSHICSTEEKMESNSFLLPSNSSQPTLLIRQSPIPQNISNDVSSKSIHYESIPVHGSFKNEPLKTIMTASNARIGNSFIPGNSNNNATSGVQSFSGVPIIITQYPQSEVIGTIIQPSNFQSNVIWHDQVVENGVEVITNPQMTLVSQPSYYGLETIVHNTVMSSQQFVSTAIQSILSQNASYSATTTQVFQASKIEPFSGYVIMSNPVDDSSLLQDQENRVLYVTGNAIQSTTPHSENVHYFQNFLGNEQNYAQFSYQNEMHSQLNTKANMNTINLSADKTELTINDFPTKVTQQIVNNFVAHPILTSQNKIHLSDSDALNAELKNEVGLAKIIASSSVESCATLSETQSSAENLKISPSNAVKHTTKDNYLSSFPCEIGMQTKKPLNNVDFVSKKDSENRREKFKGKASVKNYLSKNNAKSRKKVLYKKNESSEFQGVVPQQNDYLAKPLAIKSELVKVGRKKGLILCKSSSQVKGNQFHHNISVCYSNNNLQNIPTNVVSPIQHHPTSLSISRPTNRVLPMQSITSTNESYKKTSKPSTKSNSNKYNVIAMNSNSADQKSGNEKQPFSISLELKHRNDVSFFCDSFEQATLNTDESKSYENTILTEKETYKPKGDVGVPKLTNNLPKIHLVEQSQPLHKKSDCIADRQELVNETLREENNISKQVYCSNNTNSTMAELHKIMDEIVDVDKDVGGFFKESSPQILKDNSKSGLQRSLLSPNKLNGDNLNIEPYLLYEIRSDDGFVCESSSITEIWEKVFKSVQLARRVYGLRPLPDGSLADMCGVQAIGLKTNALKYLIEQLPGVEQCVKYTPKYHKRDSVAYNTPGYIHNQDDIDGSLYGCGKCQPYVKRSDYDMFSWLASKHRKQPAKMCVQLNESELLRRGTGSNLPMAMKYRTLKETYKGYVGVFRSYIHGRGLYCTKDIESGEMVIEYAGELIRSTLTDKRERKYDSRGIGCYMFKIDDHLVVDATMKGNAARFINHSCEPNCYSKVVDIFGHKHIIIFTLRRIIQGEELTYDYKFPFEEEKIPCSCGSKKCRKYLN